MSRLLKKRFFSVQPLMMKDQVVALDSQESHHLTHVFRVQSRDSFHVFDSAGKEWRAEMNQTDSNGNAMIRLIEEIKIPSAKRYQLTIAQAIPQRGKMDLIAEKAGELGIDVLIPMISEHTMVKIKKDQEEKVLTRWQKIVREAIKQSHSRIQTKIAPMQAFKSVLEGSSGETILLMDPSGREIIPEVLHPLNAAIAKQTQTNILILVGPEGGFSSDELSLAKSKQASFISLGDNIFKTDTAFVAIASFLKLGLS